MRLTLTRPNFCFEKVGSRHETAPSLPMLLAVSNPACLTHKSIHVQNNVLLGGGVRGRGGVREQRKITKRSKKVHTCSNTYRLVGVEKLAIVEAEGF